MAVDTLIGIALGMAFVAGVVILALPNEPLNWQFWYRRYLNSRRWHKLSWQVKRRDFYSCRHCGQGRLNGVELQAHHPPGTYRKWWWYALCLPERKRNLLTLCRDCHARLHGREE